MRVFLACCVVTSALCVSSWASQANAEALSPDGRGSLYWAGHLGATFGVLVVGAVVGAGQEPMGDGPYQNSAVALRTLQMLLPVPALATANGGSEFRIAMLLYGESLVAGFTVDRLSRLIGGGTSTAMSFSSATTSSYLFQETKSATAGFIWLNWAVQFGLAGASTTLRASEVGEGAPWYAAGEGLLGIGVGLIPSALSGGSIGLTWQAATAGAGGLLVGTVLGLLPQSQSDTTPTISLVPLQVGPDGNGFGLQGYW